MYWVVVDMYDVVQRGLSGEFDGRGREAWDELSIGFFRRHQTTLIFFAIIYIPATFGLKRLMKNRKRLELKWPLRLWNLWMFLFSLWGAWYMTPPVLFQLFRVPVYEATCSFWCFDLDPMVGVCAGFFNFFKFMEFTDTLFIVLRKRPLVFLHWYHHILTMLMCWYGNQFAHYYNCAGVFFVPMNFFVHTVMYFYYFLASMGYRPKWDFFVTLIQTVQMVIGVFLMSVALTCPLQNWVHNGLIFIMYASYLYLFVKIVLERYVWKTRDASVKAHHAKQRALEINAKVEKKEK